MFSWTTLGFFFPLQFRHVSLPTIVPGANSPRSKREDSSVNSISDDEEIIKECSHSIPKKIQLTARFKIYISNFLREA